MPTNNTTVEPKIHAICIIAIISLVLGLLYISRIRKKETEVTPGTSSDGQEMDDTISVLKYVFRALSEVGPQARLADVSKAVVDVCLTTLETPLVTLFTIDPYVGGIECEASEGVSTSVQTAFMKLGGQLVTEREYRDPWTLDISCKEPIDSSIQVMSDSGIRYIIACPIRSAAGASGALVAYYGRNIAPVHAIHYIQAIAAQASVMISYAHEIEQACIFRDGLAGENMELSAQASVDGLTGLANHRTFQQKLQDLCASRSGRPQRTFSLIMLDVDHFKMYNDIYGHQEGDRVLRVVADVLTSTLRQGDTAARYGGEEFALVLPNADKHQAMAVAERIRRTISSQENDKRMVTVSMGIAECPLDDTAPNAIIEKADRALYHAKITGRNRVVLWGNTEFGDQAGEDASTNVQSDSKTVLVVGNQRSAGQISKALTRTQCHVELAEDAASAVELLKTTGFDIALVNVSSLPGADVKSLSDITAIHPDMPVVLITNSHLLEENREALHRGASDVLLEPYNPSELPMLIERNLERCRIERQRMLEHGTSVMLQAIDSLVAAIDARDHCTSGHSHRVTTLSAAIAEELNIPCDDRAALELAARLHDIGKLGVPDSALNKQSKLTEAEWTSMYQHPILGSKIVGTIDELAYVSTIIRHHHERLDGTGYPDGLQGPAIPYPARVIAVADAYEAMITKRAHRKCRTPKEAFAELRNHIGEYYDEEIVEALGRHLVKSGELAAISEKKAA